MAHVTRAEHRDRTRVRVLTAARAEFLRHGYTHTSIDAVAARAALSRGTVYTHFPSKPALYLGVLTDHATSAALPAPETSAGTEAPGLAPSPAEAVRGFATQWLRQLQPRDPEPGTDPGAVRVSALCADLLPLAVTSPALRAPLTGLSALTAAVLALALRDLDPRRPAVDYRPIAETTIATLLAATIAPWSTPHADLRYIPDQCAHHATQITGTATSVAVEAEPSEPWEDSAIAVGPLPWCPPGGHDLLHDGPAHLYRDQLLLYTGLHIAPAIVSQLAVLPSRTPITLVVMRGLDRDVEPLAQLLLGLTCRALRASVPADALPALQIVVDTASTFALAGRILDATADTLTAVTIADQMLTHHADGVAAVTALLTGDR
ncbi:TetR/AcrR family transcriptional regulator [Nocardia wallacei]|uniref:TetR/AcrR family transcriptional regulator n=1 Tax=Nocardia wallacei TaxID=480035 RepID=UPI002453AEAD|nr:TetR/AcrR family transcriptional regulator [Nocardia wallacei]